MLVHGRYLRVTCTLLLVLAMLILAAGPGYADPNVPEAPSAGPAPQASAPALKPLPAAGLPRAHAPEDLGGIISDPVIEMRALVLHAAGDAGGVYATISAYLQILGIPFDVIDTAAAAPAGTVEEGDLWDGVNRGHYQAIFITTSNVWASHLDAAERSLIEAYARAFGVRQVTLYAYPNAAEYGLDLVGVAPLPLNATLTGGGQGVFSYLRPDVTIPFQLNDVYGYQAQPASGADVTTLLQDPTTKTLLAVFRPGDGREQMVFTMSSFYPAIPPSNIHARLLPYGMINWALRGVFLGQRHLYFAPQPDDVLGWGDCWDPINHVYILDTCYRNEPHDLDNLATWQNTFKANVPNAAGFRIEMPFNSEEVFEGNPPEVINGQVAPGTLAAKAVQLQGQFTWLNHTYSHADLDAANASVISAEISQNNGAAGIFGWTDYSQSTLLTGDYSGMGRSINPPTPRNTALAPAAYALGVRYILVNASDPMFYNPTPNTGIPHPDQTAILQIPRYANNIFYAASTPAQQTDLYNVIYCPGYPGNPTPCFTYEAIMESVTNQALGFLLDFSVNPTMFHMNNLDDYGGGQTLMTDYIEMLYAKLNSYINSNVPVLSLRTQEIGQRMWDRMAYDASGVSGELRCGGEITLHTVNAATVPVTGVGFGGNVESYAGQSISHVPMAANGVTVIPGAAASVPAAVAGLTALRSGDDVTLSWDPTSQDTAGQPLSALRYRVYGYAGDAAGVTLDQFTRLAEVAVPSFTHVNAATGPAIYTYVVTAVGDNCWKRESAESARLAKAVWLIKPGYNLLSMPLIAPDPSIQAVLGTQLSGGESLDSGDRVLSFNPATQSYDQSAVYIDGTGTPLDGQWHDVAGFPGQPSGITLELHAGFWLQHRFNDQRTVVALGRTATPAERGLAIGAGPYQIIGSGAVGPLPLADTNLWQSGANGGDSADTGDRLLRFGPDVQAYDAVAVLIDGGVWADGQNYPNPSALTLEPGRGYWFHNRTPNNPFYWNYPLP